MKDTKATLHHSYEALKDTAHYNYMLQYLAETYLIRLDNPSLTECQSIYIFQRILIDIGNLRVFDLLYQRVITLSIENHKTKYEDYSQGTCQIL